MRTVLLLLLITLAYAAEVLPQQGGGLGGLGGDGGDGDDPGKRPPALKSTHEQEPDYTDLVAELLEEARSGEEEVIVVVMEEAQIENVYIMPSGTAGPKVQDDVKSGSLKQVDHNLYRANGDVKSLGRLSHVHAVCKRLKNDERVVKDVVLSGKVGVNGKYRKGWYTGCHFTIQSENRGFVKRLNSLDKAEIEREIDAQPIGINKPAQVPKERAHQIQVAEQLLNILRRAREKKRQKDGKARDPKRRRMTNPDE